MKLFYQILILGPIAVLLFIIDVPQQSPQFPYIQLTSEAHAVFGVRRRSFRRGVVIGSSAATGATATQQTQAAPAPAPATTSESGLLPMGRVVSTLPEGCRTMQASGVEYYHCGINYYRAVFQGNKLVYVTAQPD